jgi:hypothetical protein
MAANEPSEERRTETDGHAGYHISEEGKEALKRGLEKSQGVLDRGREKLQELQEQAQRDLKVPIGGPAVAAAAVVGAALLFGIGEAALGTVAGVAVYGALKRKGRRRTPEST